MDPHVAFRMPFRLLRTSDERGEFREEPANDTQLQRELEPGRRTIRDQQELLDLAPDAFGRQIVQLDSFAQAPGPVVELEIEPRRELDAAQHAKAVVAEGLRVDGPQHAARDQVALALERVDVLARDRIPARSR